MELDKEQIKQLSELVDAVRALPDGDEHHEFIAIDLSRLGNRVVVRHPSLSLEYTAYRRDLDLLEAAGFTRISRRGKGTTFFYVTPAGFRKYTEEKRAVGEPTERIEAEVRTYLDARRFREQYPAAYDKWALGEGLLWGDDSSAQLSAIGHHCREALQHFTSALVERYPLTAVAPDPKKTINRLQAVLDAVKSKLGTTESELLKALVDYWKAVAGLVERQEHAGQKEGRPLVHEDARRVVFQTMVVMYEVDRTLSRAEHVPR
jgi:hypothetical protein